MRVLPVFLFFYALQTFAQSDVGPLISVLENPAPEARNCTPADFNACFDAVCGDRNVFKRRQIADYEALYDAQTFGTQDSVSDRLTKILEQQKAKNLKIVNEMKARIVAGTYTINTKDWDDFKWDNSAYKLFSESIEWESDAAKPISGKISYRLKNTEGKSPEFIEALKAYAREQQADYSDIKTLIENNLLSDGELRTTISSLQSSLGDKVTPELKTRIESGTDLNGVAFSLAILREHRPSAYMCKTPECRNNVSRHLTRELLPKLETVREISASPLFVAAHLAHCHSAFIQSSVRVKEFDAVYNSLPALRERYLNSALTGLSAHSKGLFKTYLEEKVRYSTGVFQDPRLSLDQSLAQSGGTFSPEDGEALLEKTDVLHGLAACRGPLPIESDSFTPNPMSWESQRDGSIKTIGDPNGKDSINISEFNCTHPDLGEGVLFHELGHALSYVFANQELSTESRASFLKLRDCISQAAKNDPGNERFRGDRLTTEEDMADFLARKVMTSQRPSSCQLVHPENISVMENSLDSHSPAMRRLLLDARAKGALPTACEPIYIQYSHQFKAESCSL